MEVKNRYQIEESDNTLSFKPFHHHKTKLKWYILAIVVFGALTTYSFEPLNELFLIISIAFLIITTWFCLQELLIYIPLKYTFDRSANEVYKSTLFTSKRKIMALDEVVIFRSSEMGSWMYKMGKKKNQFVKSYSLSEYFFFGKTTEKQIAYEREILGKIEEMINRSSSKKTTHSISSSFTP